MNNQIELIGHYGNDTIHACSAWTSTSRELSEEKVAAQQMLELIRGIDGNPFEHTIAAFAPEYETH